MATRSIYLRAFVKLDSADNIVPGSLILRKNKPKVGKWKEVPTLPEGSGGITSDSFIFTVNTAMYIFGSKSGYNQFWLPFQPGTTVDAIVDWGDGTTSHITSANYVTESLHTYRYQGTFLITITGTINGFRFNTGTYSNEGQKVKTIYNFGKLNIDGPTFTYCKNIQIVAKDAPVIATSNFDGLFSDLEDTASIGDLSKYDVSGVTSMAETFNFCQALTGDFSSWNVSNVTNFSWCFSNVGYQFNGESLSTWNTSSLINAQGMFWSAWFNPNVSSWNVSNVTDMSYMFNEATNFNRDLSNWNTSNVTTMQDMFKLATSFNQSLAGFDINNVTNFSGFMTGAGISTANYDATLISWAAQTPQSGRTIDFGSSKYTLGGAAQAARNILINTYGWTITDGGGI